MDRFTSHNPANGDLVWSGNAAAEEEINSAVQKASKTFNTWSLLNVDERIKHLECFGKRLNECRIDFAEAISKETGKPLWESKAEIASMIAKIPISIEAHRKRCEEISKGLSGFRSMTRHKPHGVTAVFGPYNFPGHLPNGHIVPALLAGNTVVFKPSELTPLVGELTSQCWNESGLPDGVLNLIQGGAQTGKILAAHPGINGLFFTGSSKTGDSLYQQFAKHPEKILALEMGGNNPLVVSRVNDISAAVYMTVQSAYLTGGQRCTCARRLILVENSAIDTFLKALIDMIGGLSIGAYTSIPEPFMGPLISHSAVEHLLTAQTYLVNLGGISLLESKALQSGSCFVTPGLIDVTGLKNVPDEEIFAPFLQIIRVPDFAKAVEEANKTSFGLSAGLLSDDKNEYLYFYNRVKAGVINWNTPTTGASSSAPFGGIGRSGNHRPGAYYAADYCSYPVASMEIEQLKMPGNITPGIK